MDFEQIEDAILAALKAQMSYVRTCETYAGQLEAEIDKLVINFPAVFVSYTGSDLDCIDNASNFNEAVGFSILVAAKNLKGKTAARKDAYGCYQMIREVLTVLTNKNLGLNIEKLKPTKVSLLYISTTMAIYGIDFQTNFDDTYE